MKVDTFLHNLISLAARHIPPGREGFVAAHGPGRTMAAPRPVLPNLAAVNHDSKLGRPTSTSMAGLSEASALDLGPMHQSLVDKDRDASRESDSHNHRSFAALTESLVLRYEIGVM